MEAVQFYRIFWFMLLFVVHRASAFDAGDTIALILGLVLGILGIFACIGCFAKKKGYSSI